MTKNNWKSRYKGSIVGRAAQRLGADESGVAAVEFAFIMPILLTMYLGSMEVSQAFDINKRVGRASSMIADLITQQSKVSRAELRAISDIGQSIILPYQRTMPTVEMIGIQITMDKPPKSLVEWSLKNVGGSISVPYSKGTAIEIPDRLKEPGTFVVRAETLLDYQPVTTWSIGKSGGSGAGTINLGKQLYLRPRLVGVVECTDC